MVAACTQVRERDVFWAISAILVGFRRDFAAASRAPVCAVAVVTESPPLNECRNRPDEQGRLPLMIGIDREEPPLP